MASGAVNPDQVQRKRDCGDDQDPTAGSDQGKKKRRKGKDTSKSVTTEEPVEKPIQKVAMDVEEPTVDDVVNEADQPQDDATPKQGIPDWFKQPLRPPTPNPKWNQDKAIDDGPEQTWLNDLVNVEKDSLTFDELMATPIDFCMFAMNCLKLDKITKADLKNPEGDKCPYDLSKPLSLQGSLGHLTIPVDFFFNNDLEYLKTGNSERKYTIYVTKTKAARYDLRFIEDMIPRLWSPVKVAYDKDAALGISQWGPKLQIFYSSQVNRLSRHDVYLKIKILSLVSVKVDKKYSYGYLEEFVVRRVDHKLYTFKDGDFPNLHLNDIEDTFT
ncbi:hypothetical protein Tco_0132330 [Tanacetum coccineum]